MTARYEDSDGPSLPEESPLLNVEGALNHVQGDEVFLSEIYRIFLEEIPDRLNSFREAMQKGDLFRFLRLAHSLKGVSITIGAVSCGRLAGAAEKAAREEQWEKIELLYPKLESILHELEAVLSKLLSKKSIRNGLDGEQK
jgi:HPt (histidine-containing phosphotransfer) domain-containing protein